MDFFNRKIVQVLFLALWASFTVDRGYAVSERESYIASLENSGSSPGGSTGPLIDPSEFEQFSDFEIYSLFYPRSHIIQKDIPIPFYIVDNITGFKTLEKTCNKTDLYTEDWVALSALRNSTWRVTELQKALLLYVPHFSGLVYAGLCGPDGMKNLWSGMHDLYKSEEWNTRKGHNMLGFDSTGAVQEALVARTRQIFKGRWRYNWDVMLNKEDPKFNITDLPEYMLSQMITGEKVVKPTMQYCRVVLPWTIRPELQKAKPKDSTPSIDVLFEGYVDPNIPRFERRRQASKALEGNTEINHLFLRSEDPTSKDTVSRYFDELPHAKFGLAIRTDNLSYYQQYEFLNAEVPIIQTEDEVIDFGTAFQCQVPWEAFTIRPFSRQFEKDPVGEIKVALGKWDEKKYKKAVTLMKYYKREVLWHIEPERVAHNLLIDAARRCVMEDKFLRLNLTEHYLGCPETDYAKNSVMPRDLVNVDKPFWKDI